MAIIIPSKSIYRQNNPKVRDNAIVRVEIKCKEPVPNNEYNHPVFAISQYNNFKEEVGVESDKLLDRPDLSGYAKEAWYAYYYIRPIYLSLKVRIPKTKENTVITQIFAQKDISIGGTFVELLINGKKTTKKATAFYNVSLGKVEELNVSEEGEQENYSTNKLTPKNYYTYSHKGQGYLTTTSVTTPKKWQNFDSFEDSHIFDRGDFYEGSFYILCGYREISLGGYKYYSNQNTGINLTGEDIEYKPTRVDITINGNTVGINLVEKTNIYDLKEDGIAYSIEGNELTQTTNYYETEDNLLLEKQAENILDAYKNGKETATIRCSIVDYYDENGNLAISTSGQNLLEAKTYLWLSDATFEDGKITQSQADGSTATKFDFYLDGGTNLSNWGSVWLGAVYDVSTPQRVYITFKKENTFSIIRFKYNGATRDTSVFYDVSHLKNGEYYTFSAYISDLTQGNISWEEMQITVGEEQLPYEPFIPMCFNIYDKVIPMEYAVVDKKAQDVPMSYYEDGITPKQFQVLSTNVEYDGRVMQTLELQEVWIGDVDAPTMSRVYTIEFLLYNIVYKKKTTIMKKLDELPEPPSISAGYYFDGWYTEPNGQGKLVTTDTTFTKDTKVYANVVEDMAYTVDVTFYDTVKGIETITTGLGGYLNAFPTPKSKKYYVFAGYATLQNGEGIRVTKQYKFTENTNLYPYYVEEPTSSLFDEVYKNINQNAKDIQELDNKIEGIINPDNPDNPDTDETVYQDFVSYGDQEDNSVSGFGATGLDTSALEEYLSTATPVDGNSYEINIKPTVTNEFGSKATVEVIHSYAFADYSDILAGKQLIYVIPTTVTAFGYKAFDLTNASIVFLGDNNQFEEILANSAPQWCSVGGSGGNSGTGSYGITVTVRCGGISGPMFNYFVPFTVEP